MENFSSYVHQKYQSNPEPVGRWDVVLFMGNYDPITKDEHDRIGQFINNIIRNEQFKNLFSDNVELGLIFNDQSEDEVFADKNYILSSDEKEFLTGKLFGLRCFPVNYRQLKWLMLPVKDKNILPFNDERFDKAQKPCTFQEMFAPALDSLKEHFDSVNILIVVNPKDMAALAKLDAVTTQFEDDNIKVGFVTWKSNDAEKCRLLGNVPVKGEMIKAICLMDHDRPDPEEIKSFCYKYKLGEYLNHVKSIHFRTGGQKYIDAFMQLFPEIVIYDFDEENKIDNYRVIMEIIKKMYLKDDYMDTSITLAAERPEAQVTPEKEEAAGLPPMEEGAGGEEEMPELEL